MTFGEKLRTALLRNAAVVTAVNSRVFPVRLPSDVTLPAIRYSVVSDIPTNSLAGSTGKLRKARVQIDCYARTYLDAQELADAVAGALATITDFGFTSMQLSRRDQYEDESKLFGVSQDFSMWMAEA